MDGTVVVENNTKVLELFAEIMAVDTKRKHVSIRNKYAIGVVRKYQEVFIYDYDRSSRPLVKVKKAGQTVLLRLGFGISETLEILESLLRILQAVATPKEEPPVHHPKMIPADDPRSTIGMNKDGKIVMNKHVAFKTHTERN